MKVSLSWLKELVDHNLSPKELAEKLSLMSIGVKQTTDDFLELDLTYNRGDLLSMRGVAREVATIIDSRTKFEDLKDYVWAGKNLPELDIRDIESSSNIVEAREVAPIYCLAKVEGLEVKKSPKEIVKRLEDSGMRAVNNITDITNLVMLEYGQPLHAFDAEVTGDSIKVDTIFVPGEHFVSLDHKTRILKDGDIVIYSYKLKGTIALAGIMGGKDTEVSYSTKSILLEAAIFDPISIRRTAKRLGIQSEASKRFQHGLTSKALLQALNAAIKMYQDLGGKLTAITLIDTRDLNSKPNDTRTLEQMRETILLEDPKSITLTQQKINSLLGVEIPPDQVESSLQSLGLQTGFVGSNWEVTVPYWRLDINIEEDLIEEVARIYGYEKIAGKSLIGDLPEKLDQSFYNFLYDLKVSLKNAGLTEVQTYSFYSTDVSSNLGYDKNELIKVANPISSETEYLRNHLWPNLVEVVGKNLRQGYKDIAIFEIGKVYNSTKSGYQEEYKLSIALMNGTDNPLQELTQLSLGVNLGHPPGVQLGERIGESGGRFHPNRYVYLTYKGKSIGKIGEVHPRFLNNFGIEKRVAILEIDIESLPK